MHPATHSVIWGIGLSLFAGGLGVPLPENALLIAGGYAIYQKISPPFYGMILWYAALILGDASLFLLVRWLFSRPSLSALMNHVVRPDKLGRYKCAFSRHGALTLFLARFTFGIRAAAYVAAGVSGYPFRKFLAVDSISVGVQVLLFIAIGYYGSGRIEWEKAATHEIALLIALFAVLSILVSIAASLSIRRFSQRPPQATQSQTKETTH